MREKKIYLLLTDTGTLFNRIIKVYTNAPYNHASIAFDEELEEVYSFGRKNPRNPFRAGLVKEDIYSGLFQYAAGAVYCLTVSEKQFQKMYHDVQSMYAKRESYHYHLLGLFGVMINMPIKKENAFFCSQFVSTVLKKSGSIDFAVDISLIKPSDLPYTANFQLMYQGELRDFANGEQRSFIG